MNESDKRDAALAQVASGSHNYYPLILAEARVWVHNQPTTARFTTAEACADGLRKYPPAEKRVTGAVMRQLAFERLVEKVPGHATASHKRPVQSWSRRERVPTHAEDQREFNADARRAASGF